MRTRSPLTLFIIALIVAFPLYGFSQQNEIIVMDQRQVTKSYDMDDNGYLYVKNITGDIKVTSWNRNKIEIDISKRGRRDDIEVIIDKRGTSVYIEVDYPDRDWRDRWSGRNNSGSIYFDIKVPVHTELDLENVTGDILATTFKSRIEASTVTGRLEIRDIEGDVYGKTTTGSVEIWDVTGSVDAHSTTGGLDIRNTGDVDAHATTGRIEISNRNGSNIQASITTGHIDVELEKVDVRGRYEFKSTTGDIRLGIPGDTKADITARVRPRNLQSDFDLFDRYEDRYRGRRYDRYYNSARTFEGELNGGGARIYMSTSHGDIDLRKR